MRAALQPANGSPPGADRCRRNRHPARDVPRRLIDYQNTVLPVGLPLNAQFDAHHTLADARRLPARRSRSNAGGSADYSGERRAPSAERRASDRWLREGPTDSSRRRKPRHRQSALSRHHPGQSARVVHRKGIKKAITPQSTVCSAKMVPSESPASASRSRSNTAPASGYRGGLPQRSRLRTLARSDTSA